MGLLYLEGPTIQEVGGEIMMGLSIYRVAVIDGSLYSRFYGIIIAHLVLFGCIWLYCGNHCNHYSIL